MEPEIIAENSPEISILATFQQPENPQIASNSDYLDQIEVSYLGDDFLELIDLGNLVGRAIDFSPAVDNGELFLDELWAPPQSGM